MPALRTRGSIYRKIATNLREFGYPDVTHDMIRECYDAWAADLPMPHGVIGYIAKRDFDEAGDLLKRLPE